jgi:hypothetical protein
VPPIPAIKLLSHLQDQFASVVVSSFITVHRVESRVVSLMEAHQESVPDWVGHKAAMAYKDIFWMACDSTEQLRAEYGPFHTREEAEAEARKLSFRYLLRYEHILGSDDEIEEVRCVFLELQDIELPDANPQDANPQVEDKSPAPKLDVTKAGVTFHTRCASCGEAAAHEQSWQAEVWADIHEFEHTRHKVRLFEHARGEGLKEIADWRGRAA